MSNEPQTIDKIATLLCKSTKHILETSTKQKIEYSKTFQQIPKVTMAPDIGCFVQFTGNYNGLVVINLTEAAAMEIYTSYMKTMGMPESELVKDFTSNDVADSIGEITNQIMGLLMRTVEDKFDLSSFCGQPKALALNSAITLIIDCEYQIHRRLAFDINGKPFHMEIAMEQTEFIKTNF
jgi:CheY-specific phosphatase CheX